MNDSFLESIEDIIKKERSLLLSGDILEAADLLKEKERIFDSLNKNINHLKHNDLSRLIKLSQQNQVLLESASRGLKAAMKEIHACYSQSAPFVYSKDGNQQMLNSHIAKVERKL